jgi:hypothetical protein
MMAWLLTSRPFPKSKILCCSADAGGVELDGRVWGVHEMVTVVCLNKENNLDIGPGANIRRNWGKVARENCQIREVDVRPESERHAGRISAADVDMLLNNLDHDDDYMSMDTGSLSSRLPIVAYVTWHKRAYPKRNSSKFQHLNSVVRLATGLIADLEQNIPPRERWKLGRMELEDPT